MAAIGNAVDPCIVEWIGRAILDVEASSVYGR
jgi:site-specific DNA-cytosine methylase